MKAQDRTFFKKLRFSILTLVFIQAISLLSIQNFANAFEIQDSRGNVLVIDATPKSVISLVPTATEIIFEIGAQNSIIALTYHDALLQGASDKKIVGGFFQPSIEKIKNLKPDMIILSSFHNNIIDDLKDSDCKLFIYDTKIFEQSYENILTFGKLFNKREQAKAVIQKNRQKIDHIKQKLDKAVSDRKKRVIRLMGRDKIMTPGRDSFQNELIRLAGGIPPDFVKKGSAVTVTKEEWIKFNPEVIYGCEGDEKAAQKFFSKNGWKDVDAVKNHQIYYFPCELTCRASTHSGYFISWLSSLIYTKEFSESKNNVLDTKKELLQPVKINLDYVKSASIDTTTVFDFANKTLMIDFKRSQMTLSTLEGERTGILSVGNHYSPPPTWMPGHLNGIENIRGNILKANNKQSATTSFLITGADMNNLSVKEKIFKEMKVVVLATAGVMGNAVRMSKDIGKFYEPGFKHASDPASETATDSTSTSSSSSDQDPGTINIIIMTNMKLSKRAMTRAIISATEGKTAALEDLDIRSSYSPMQNEATGTGTDNILVVQGEGFNIDNTGGHSKMGELIANAVYDAVKQAILKQNKVTANRNIFQRLKERKISVYELSSKANLKCMNRDAEKKNDFLYIIEHVMLDPKYRGFLESALAISDEYEKGLIRDLSLFEQWSLATASKIAGKDVAQIQDLIKGGDEIPYVLKTAINTIFTGALEQLKNE